MYKVKGLETKKTHFIGGKSDCHRYLLELYPSLTEKDYEQHGQQAQIKQVLPELMQIRRISK